MSIPTGIPLRAYGVTAFVCRREGETAWQATLREIREESGLCPDRFYYADMREQCYDANVDCVCVIPVFVAFLDSEQAVVLNEEHRDYRWVTFDEAQALLPFASRQAAVLRHIEREFIQRPPNESLRLPPTESVGSW